MSLLIRGATMIDGLGHEPKRADVLVKDGKIADIGDIKVDFRARFDRLDTRMDRFESKLDRFDSRLGEIDSKLGSKLDIARFDAAAAAIEMLFITILYWNNGFNWMARGYEYVLMWGLVCFAISLRGGGRYSLDRLIGREL